MKPRHLTKREADALISREYKRIQNRARRYARRHANVDEAEIESAAMEGLIRAARNFDPSHACRATFSTYASGVVDDYMSKARNRCWRSCNRADDLAGLQKHEDADSSEAPTRNTSRRTLPIAEDHSDVVLGRDEFERHVHAWLALIDEPQHRKALLLFLSCETYAEIGRRLDVHETTARRWILTAQEKYVASLYPEKETGEN